MTLAELGRYGEAAGVQADPGRGGMRDIVPRLAANLRLYERGRDALAGTTPCRAGAMA